MEIRSPYEKELDDVYELFSCIPAVTLPPIEQFKERVTAGNYPQVLAAIDSDETVAGVAVFSMYRDFWGDGECFLYILAVKPELRRKKIGTALLNAVKERAKAIECSFIQFIVHEENNGAIDFYKTHGLIEEKLGEFKRVYVQIDGDENENTADS